MICYKDMTFCKSDCTNDKCHRHFTEDVRKDAEKWWGGENAPVAFSNFATHCEGYKK